MPMRWSILWLAVAPLPALLVAGLPCGSGSGEAEESVELRRESVVQRDRSPMAVAVSPDGRLAVSANHTAGSVSLVDLNCGRVIVEHVCGGGPADVLWADASTLLVSLSADDALAIVDVARDGDSRTLSTRIQIPVGDEPVGLALLPGSHTAAVALAGLDQVAIVDIEATRVVRRIPVGGIPKTLAVSPDGRWLITCCNVPGEVFVHDTRTFELLSRRNVFDNAFNLGNPLVLPGGEHVVLASAINRTFPISEANIEKGWGIDNRLTQFPLPDGEYWQQRQLGLDVRGNACGDAQGLALSTDGRLLAVTCGGSHELMILDREQLKWPTGDPGDFLPAELLDRPHAVRRVELGGRSLGIAAIDERRAVVANYLNNALDVVDLVDARLLQSIDLGGPPEPSLARRGEAIFHDADRSFDSWFSCHTCHPDGHTSGQTFDTLNDGNYDTYKLTPSLRGVVHTSPWTWHGWQNSLEAALHKSMRDTLSTQRPFDEGEAAALLAYLATLESPPSPRVNRQGRLTSAARRGKRLFDGKAGCAACHAGEHFTSPATYTVGLESPRYFYPEFNPPSLRGLHTRRVFLHDGRAESLEEVLTRHHRPEDLAGERLTAAERSDLIAWLRSL